MARCVTLTRTHPPASSESSRSVPLYWRAQCEVQHTEQALHTSDDWETFKGILQFNYLDGGLHLKDLMVFMEREHNFKATESMYKKRFKRWRFEKYCKAQKGRVDILIEGYETRPSISASTRNQSILPPTRVPDLQENQKACRFRGFGEDVRSIRGANDILECQAPFTTTRPLPHASDAHRNQEQVLSAVRTWFQSIPLLPEDMPSKDRSDQVFDQFMDGVVLLSKNPRVGWLTMNKACDAVIPILQTTEASLMVSFLQLATFWRVRERHPEVLYHILRFVTEALEQLRRPNFPLLVVVRHLADETIVRKVIESLLSIFVVATSRTTGISTHTKERLELKIAWALVYCGMWDEGRAIFQRFVSIRSQQPDHERHPAATEDLTTAYWGLGSLARRRLDFKGAVSYYESALRACRHLGAGHRRLLEMQTRPRLATTYRKYVDFLETTSGLDTTISQVKDMYAEEETCYWKSLDIALNIGTAKDQKICVFDLADCLWRHGNVQGMFELEESIRRHPVATAYPELDDASLFGKDPARRKQWWKL